MELTGKNILGGSLSGESNSFFQGVNPATTQKLNPVFFEATTAEINNAIQKAYEEFQTYRNIS
jgi:hypothetical protein